MAERLISSTSVVNALTGYEQWSSADHKFAQRSSPVNRATVAVYDTSKVLPPAPPVLGALYPRSHDAFFALSSSNSTHGLATR